MDTRDDATDQPLAASGALAGVAGFAARFQTALSAPPLVVDIAAAAEAARWDDPVDVAPVWGEVGVRAENRTDAVQEAVPEDKDGLETGSESGTSSSTEEEEKENEEEEEKEEEVEEEEEEEEEKVGEIEEADEVDGETNVLETVHREVVQAELAGAEEEEEGGAAGPEAQPRSKNEVRVLQAPRRPILARCP